MRQSWRRPLGVLIAAILAGTLTGCGSASREERLELEERINVYPGSYRADLAAALRSYVNDPSVIRDVYVAEPGLTQVSRDRRYTACVRFNAPAGDGRYARRDALAIFTHGRFDQFIEASASTDLASQESLSALVKKLCESADYRRFTELDPSAKR